MIESVPNFVVVIHHLETGRKEVWVNGKLVQVLYPPPGFTGGW